MPNDAKGTIYYGIHLYPGVVQYDPPDKKSYKLFLNEDALRSMDQSFAGRPVFVEHVDGVSSDKAKLKNEADGWVIESFFNQNDGKHWVKFIIVSDEGERGIRNGMRLSNSYFPLSFAEGGVWNAIPYDKRLISGEYEHLALVKNPRYAESIILTCEQFKKYNEEKLNELNRLKNNNDNEGDDTMALNFWKRAKLDNSLELEGMCVTLPKSKKEISIVDLISNADEEQLNVGKSKIANANDTVTVDGKSMKVSDLVSKYESLIENQIEEDETDEETINNDDVTDVSMDEAAMNEEEKMKKKKKKKMKKDAAMMDEEDEEDYEIEKEKKKNELEEARKKALKLKNSGPLHNEPQELPIELTTDNIARGKLMYGQKRG